LELSAGKQRKDGFFADFEYAVLAEEKCSGYKVFKGFDGDFYELFLDFAGGGVDFFVGDCVVIKVVNVDFFSNVRAFLLNDFCSNRTQRFGIPYGVS